MVRANCEEREGERGRAVRDLSEALAALPKP